MSDTKKKTVAVGPLAQVKKQHGSRADLIEKILPLLDDPDAAAAKRALTRTPNAKLITLLAAGTAVQKQFGSRQALVAAVVKATYPKGNVPEGYEDKLAAYNLKRLYDLYQKRA